MTHDIKSRFIQGFETKEIRFFKNVNGKLSNHDMKFSTHAQKLTEIGGKDEMISTGSLGRFLIE